MKTILVVEDDPHQGLLYEQELSDEGYRVVRAANGREGLGMVKVQPPDCLIMDINMPVMDGLDALGKILAVRPALPVIINSAFSSYRESFLSWAADAYVVKSSDLSELKQRVREAVTKRAMAAA